MRFFLKQTYLPLTSLGHQSSFWDGDDETTEFLPEKARGDVVTLPNRYDVGWLTILNTLMFLTSITLFSAVFYKQYLIPNAAMRRVSSYTPIHDHFDLDPRIQRINGTLFPPKEPSIARQFPNEAADELWDEWELRRIYPVTRSELLRMGADPTTAVKLENDLWGLGDDSYAASWDVYHQLHCLNHLRRMAYSDHYNMTLPRAHPENPTKSEIHTNHCVDILMQSLQCSGNVNLISLHWVETQHHPFPDFSIPRHCINFEGLTEWRREKSLNMDKWIEVMRKPAGVNQLPMADAYYELYDKDNPNHVGGANPEDDFNI